MTKSLVISGIFVTALGLIIMVISIITSGLLYRIDEDRGLEPAYAPPLVEHGFNFGFWTFVVGMLLLIAAAVVAIIQKRQNHRANNL